jgi:glycerol-3-phosphate dehydrogenase (NAD(P)+)
MNSVAILGAGSWGTALAVHLSHAGHRVRLWARDPELVSRMASSRTNPTYLPETRLSDAIEPTSSLEHALDGSAFVTVAVPSHGVRSVLRAAAPFVPPGAVVVSATKGLETDSLLRMSEVATAELGHPRRIAVLSGPSFALEVARQCPTALVVASCDGDTAVRVQHEFRGRYLRLYVTDDVVGVETGGAIKNVIAIAAGVAEGLGLGHNAMAALITRGLAEVSRLACALGGRRETLAGLSGMGDLVLTCTGQLSRNRHVGMQLARGRPLDEILAGMKMVAEGVRTTAAAVALGARHGAELPITAQMAEVLAGRKAPRDGLEELMLRRQRPEHESSESRWKPDAGT